VIWPNRATAVSPFPPGIRPDPFARVRGRQILGALPLPGPHGPAPTTKKPRRGGASSSSELGHPRWLSLLRQGTWELFDPAFFQQGLDVTEVRHIVTAALCGGATDLAGSGRTACRGPFGPGRGSGPTRSGRGTSLGLDPHAPGPQHPRDNVQHKLQTGQRDP